MNVNTVHTEKDILKYIEWRTEESLHLEFKRGEALNKSDSSKKEIAKDVSAFANAEGGVLIYGIEEIDHVASKVSPIVDDSLTKEWLEQTIAGNIKRKVPNISIDPIRTEEGTIYVVRIPKSKLRPHQTSAYRYYRRQNFSVAEMDEHEIRELYQNPEKEVPIIESPQEQVARLERERIQKQKRENLLHSEKGLKLATNQVYKIPNLIKEQEKLILSKIPDWFIGTPENNLSQYHGKISVMSYAVYLVFEYRAAARNSGSDFELGVKITTGGGRTFEEYKVRHGARLLFGLSEENQPGWMTGNNKFISTESLLDEWYGKFLKTAQSLKDKA